MENFQLFLNEPAPDGTAPGMEGAPEGGQAGIHRSDGTPGEPGPYLPPPAEDKGGALEKYQNPK